MSRRPAIAVVDYGMGNLRSVSAALEHLGAEPRVSSRPDELAAAEGLVLPGVGAFGDAARSLRRLGLAGPLRDAALAAAEGSGRPLLGICLGLQLFFAGSEEAPGEPGLDVLAGGVLRFPESSGGGPVKVPHMGWNSVEVSSRNALTEGVADGEHFYFVHSYYARTDRPEDTCLVCEYAGVRFAAMAARGQLFASQFHPEKSQAAGLALLGAFVEMCG